LPDILPFDVSGIKSMPDPTDGVKAIGLAALLNLIAAKTSK
jgi:hypothetical protein